MLGEQRRAGGRVTAGGGAGVSAETAGYVARCADGKGAEDHDPDGQGERRPVNDPAGDPAPQPHLA